MEYFAFDPTNVVEPLAISTIPLPDDSPPDELCEPFRGRTSSPALRTASSADLADQFALFQLSPIESGPALLETTDVVPTLEGSDGEPDVLVGLELQSFHLSEQDRVSPQTKATLRLTMGKDHNSRDRLFDSAFWAVAAGLSLYDESSEGLNKTPAPKALGADITGALGNRPIEVPGGLAQLSFQVVRHTEPPWWRRVFDFLDSGTGNRLTSVLGFPAITSQAIRLVDELFNRLDASNEPEILFGTGAMRFALNVRAKSDYTGGNPRIRLGSISPGFCILVRGRDYDLVRNIDPVYYPTFGVLAPADLPFEELLSGNANEALNSITYAVLRFGMRQTKLDPTFDYG